MPIALAATTAIPIATVTPMISSMTLLRIIVSMGIAPAGQNMGAAGPEASVKCVTQEAAGRKGPPCVAGIGLWGRRLSSRFPTLEPSKGPPGGVPRH